MKWDDSPTGFAFLGTWTWAQLLALVTFIPCATKNIINIVQLWKASKILVGVDLAEREKAREEAEALKNRRKH
jgi:CDP-diacylglycerol--inositol 3-phosphatidyltransferase